MKIPNPIKLIVQGNKLPNAIGSFLLTLLCYWVPGTGHTSENPPTISKYGVGFALAMPALGVSFEAVLSESRTVSLVAGSGAQVQLNFTGQSPLGGYYLVGAGYDTVVGLVRLGYGYKWQFNAISVHAEAALNIPVVDDDLGEGLANLSKIVYAFPLGVGVSYRF